jgi:transcriptional regulator with XRE-family HTH domain
VGVGPDHLSKIFRGIGNPSLTLALKLANAMHIGIAQLTEQLLEARDQHEILKQAARKKKLKAKKPQPDGEDGEQDEHERLAG